MQTLVPYIRTGNQLQPAQSQQKSAGTRSNTGISREKKYHKYMLASQLATQDLIGADPIEEDAARR